ncbi:MAG: RDD family protein [Steroidobacteraceae bacterium]|nr:RDD family protein [Steroidobacteraceae bacterium]
MRLAGAAVSFVVPNLLKYHLPSATQSDSLETGLSAGANSADGESSTACGRCGALVSADDICCSACGARIRADAPAETQVTETAGLVWSGPVYAGLWKRAAAVVIDTVLLYVVMFVIGGLLGVFMTFSNAPAPQAALVAAILGVLVGAVYEIAFHASPFQATVGKAALRIKVTDLQGMRLSVARSAGRYLAKFLNGWTLGVGLVMAGFTRRRQALHDKLAGTLVVREKAVPAVVAAAEPEPPAGLVRIALLVLLGLMPYVLLAIAVLPAAWQLMQLRAATPPATHAPQISQEDLEGARRQVRAVLFAVQPHRAELGRRLASGEPFEQIGGTIEVDARNIESIDILNGAILIVFGDDAAAGLAREQLAMVPARRRDGTVTWLCGYAERPPGVILPIEDYYEYTSVDEAYLPAICRQAQ